MGHRTARPWRKPSTTLGALLLVSLGLFSEPAAAEHQAALEMARERFQEGVAYFDEGRFEEARAAFLQAYALRKHPAVLLNIALSELRAGYHSDAAAHFVEYLHTAEEMEESERDAALEGLDEAKQHVSELRLSADVEGAEIFLDDQNLGRTPLSRPLFVKPGPHDIRARRGDETFTTTVDAKASQIHEVAVVLLPDDSSAERSPPTPQVPQPSAPQPSVLQPSSVSKTANGGSADSGSRTATSRNDVAVADDSAQRTAPIGSHDVATWDTPTYETRRPFGEWLISSPVGLTGLVITGAGLGLGTAGAIVATNRYRAARDASDDISTAAEASGRTGTICVDGTSPWSRFQSACSERQHRLNQGDTWRALSIGGFVGAAAAAAGTVAYYFLESPTAQPVDQAVTRPTVVVPIVTPEMQGLSVTGSF